MSANAKVRDLVELRIHGVSGTSAASLLEYADTVQVAGDKRSGFHRRRGWNGYGAAEAGDEIGGTRRHLEAFSWGGLTSGSASRAAWLLLLPFALVNVAAWSHPAGPDGAAPAAGGPAAATPWGGFARHAMLRSLRVLGLVLTLSLVTTAAGIGLDIVAWQCAAEPRCGNGDNALVHRVIPFLRVHAAGGRLAAGAALPFAVLAVLWVLGRWSYRQYECKTHDGVPGGNAGRSPFGSAGFWKPKDSICRLRSLHVAASLALVAGLVTYPLTPDALVRGLWSGAIGVVVLCVLLLLFTSTADVAEEIDGKMLSPTGVPRVLRLTATALAGTALVVAAQRGDQVRTGGKLPGYGFVLWSLAVSSMLAVLAVVATTFAARSRHVTGPRPFVHGMLTPVLATLGLAIGGAMAAGATYLAADFFGTPPGLDPNPVRFEFILHELYLGTSLVLIPVCALLLVAALLTVGYCRLRFDDDIAELGGGVCADYHADPATDPERIRYVARTRYFGGLTERGAGVLGVLAAGGAITALGAMGFAIGAHGHIGAVLGAERFAGVHLADVALVGSRLVVLLVTGMALLGVLAYRRPAMRRTVGILWDLATFWPRAAHPLAPPCYCERTVPQLTKRVAALAAGDSRVLVSAHSQGSIMTAAAVLQLPSSTLAHVALVTHGSPLRRLYARAFPAYFHEDLFELIRDTMADNGSTRWRNCWRRTDYLGGLVFGPTSNGVDVPVLDPVAHPQPCAGNDAPLHAAAGDILPVPALRHSNYYVSPEYNQAVWDLDVRLTGMQEVDLVQPRSAVTLPSAMS
jgi:hypothetical protein